MVAVVKVLSIVELRGGEGGEERVVIRVGQRSIQRTLLTEVCGMHECGSVNAVHVKRLLVLTAGVVQHFQHRGAPGHMIILSGTTINCVNSYKGD